MLSGHPFGNSLVAQLSLCRKLQSVEALVSHHLCSFDQAARFEVLDQLRNCRLLEDQRCSEIVLRNPRIEGDDTQDRDLTVLRGKVTEKFRILGAEIGAQGACQEWQILSQGAEDHPILLPPIP